MRRGAVTASSKRISERNDSVESTLASAKSRTRTGSKGFSPRHMLLRLAAASPERTTMSPVPLNRRSARAPPAPPASAAHTTEAIRKRRITRPFDGRLLQINVDLHVMPSLGDDERPFPVRFTGTPHDQSIAARRNVGNREAAVAGRRV